jgi:anthranilate synthase component 2
VKVLLIDNFDSFTFNIAHYLEILDVELIVVDHFSVTESLITQADALVLSPGPGLPSEAGLLMKAIEMGVSLRKPILGICLGMQALAVYTGENLYNQQQVKHGVGELITCKTDAMLFAHCSETFQVGLYHSWAVEIAHTDFWQVDAVSMSRVNMAISHTSLPLFGVQFHPESILTTNGMRMLENFIAFAETYHLAEKA